MTIQEFIQQNIPDYDKRSTDIALRVEKILNSNMTSRQKIEHYSGLWSKLFLEASQWNKAENILPGKNEFVLCKMKHSSGYVAGYIYLKGGIPTIATKPNFEFEDLGDYEVSHWKYFEECTE